MDVQLCTTERGKDLLIVDGYAYYEKRKLKSDEIVFQCSTKKECTAKVYTLLDKTSILRFNTVHCHEKEEENIQKKILKQSAKRKAEDVFERPFNIIHSVITENPTCLRNLTTRDVTNLRKVIYRKRRKQMPSLPKIKDEAIEKLLVDDCKKRWENIKDAYNKLQKKGIGDSGNKKKKLQLVDSLAYLNKTQSTSSNQSGETQSQEEASQLPSTSSSNDILPQNAKDTHSSSGQTSRVITMPSQIPPTSSTKDSQSSNVEDIPNSSRQTSRGIRETSQCHPTPSTNGQSHGVEDVRTLRRPRKRPRLNGNFSGPSDSGRIERDILLKLIAEEKREDDVDLFFRSISASVKKLRHDLIHEAKMRCLQMVFDLENRNAIDSIENRFSFAAEHSRSPSPYSHISLSPSSVENTITIKTEIDDTEF